MGHMQTIIAQHHITELKLRGEVEAAQARQVAYESVLIDENTFITRVTHCSGPHQRQSASEV